MVGGLVIMVTGYPGEEGEVGGGCNPGKQPGGLKWCSNVIQGEQKAS